MLGSCHSSATWPAVLALCQRAFASAVPGPVVESTSCDGNQGWQKTVTFQMDGSGSGTVPVPVIQNGRRPLSFNFFFISTSGPWIHQDQQNKTSDFTNGCANCGDIVQDTTVECRSVCKLVSRTDNFVNLPDGPPFYFWNRNRRFYSLEPVPVRGGPEPRFRFRYWLPTLTATHQSVELDRVFSILFSFVIPVVFVLHMQNTIYYDETHLMFCLWIAWWQHCYFDHPLQISAWKIIFTLF